MAESIPVHWLGKNGAELKYHMTVINPTEGILDLAITAGNVTPGRDHRVPGAGHDYGHGRKQRPPSPKRTKRSRKKTRNGRSKKNWKIKEELVKSVKERVKFASEIKSRKVRGSARRGAHRRLSPASSNSSCATHGV